MSSFKEGWLTKQGGFIKSWKKRWFVLNQDQLCYYTQSNGECRGTIPLANSPVSLAPECKQQPAFKITTKDRTYYLAGDTQPEVDLWMQAIRAVQAGELEGLGEALKAAQMKANSDVKKHHLEDFEMLKVLGKGTYGKVMLVKRKDNGQILAMKQMSKQLLAEYEQVAQIMTEKEVLMKNSHPFLVSAHCTFQSEDKIYMVIDYVPGGELFKRLSDEGQFPESRVKLYAAEILLGLGHLHSLDFIYRDLKPENILVDAQGHLKITDFGLAKKVVEATSTFCGTPEYLAPEMLLGEQYTKAVDWWSFGTLIYEMLTGLPPYYHDNVQVMYKMILNQPVPFQEGMSETAIDLISQLLVKEPENRLGSNGDAEEIKAHPFFADLNWDDVLNKRTKPEWIPTITSETDVQNFDSEFTDRQINSLSENVVPDDGTQQMFTGFTCVDEKKFN